MGLKSVVSVMISRPRLVESRCNVVDTSVAYNKTAFWIRGS